jgi:toxin CptA
LAAFLLVAHGAALGVVLAVPLEWYWRVLLAVAVVGGLVHALGAHVLYLFPRAVREATWDSDGTWILTLVSGEREEASLLPSTYVTARLLVLSFRCARWRHRALVLATDALEPNLLRRLRVRLRLAGAERTADTDVFK